MSRFEIIEIIIYANLIGIVLGYIIRKFRDKYENKRR